MKAVVFQDVGRVEVADVSDASLDNPKELGGICRHGVIIRVVASGICGSDHHIYRGRAEAPPGFVLGHEATGEVVEVGPDVQTVKVGDWCSVPFNVACGRCTACKSGRTAHCTISNPGGVGAAYGYPGLGPWRGAQAEYMLVPYADFNLLRFPDVDQARAKVLDLAMLADIFPTGFHGAVTAGVQPGSIVYVAGAGPVGLSAARSAQLLGAALVLVGDVNETRLAQAAQFGCATVDVADPAAAPAMLAELTGSPYSDASIDCVGFMAVGAHGRENSTAVLNSMFEITATGGGIGIPGAYVSEPDKPGGAAMGMNFATAWGKAHRLSTGGCPAMSYQPQLLKLVLHGRADIARVVNATPVSLDDAATSYERFDGGASAKFLLDPHGELERAHDDANA